MAKPQNPNSTQNLPSSSTPTKVSGEIGSGNTSYSAPKPHFPNPPDPTNPDPAALREQWRYAIRQYSKWYSHAWGTAIVAGLSFFALGWIIKGSNPLPSRQDDSPARPSSSSTSDDGDVGR